MTPNQIKHMVDRFLSWKLPEHFRPDCGISFAPRHYDHGKRVQWPVGTNLFDATQAEAMVRCMIDGIPKDSVDHRIRELEKAIDGVIRQVEDADSGIGSSPAWHEAWTDLKAVRHGELAVPPVTGTAGGDYHWLIEAPGIKYLAVRKLDANSHTLHWTGEHDEALHFRSEAQADGLMMALRQLAPALFGFAATLGDARAVEHAWDSGHGS